MTVILNVIRTYEDFQVRAFVQICQLMPIYDVFSRRQKQKMEGDSDPLRYDLPDSLRQQICFILKDSMGYPVGHDYFDGRTTSDGIEWWNFVGDAVKRERGLERFNRAWNGCDECLDAIKTGDVEVALDLIDVAFRFIDKIIRNKRNDYRVDPFIRLRQPSVCNELR